MRIRKHMKNLLFVSALLLIVTSCSKIRCIEDDLTFQSVDKGELYGNGDERIGEEKFVITAESEWSDLKSKMNSTNHVSEDFGNVPIDFDQQFVLASFDQVRTNGGNSIDISDVNFNGGELEVTVAKSEGSGIVGSVITQPYHIIVLDKCDKNQEVTFN
jgi:hypothetical protein